MDLKSILKRKQPVAEIKKPTTPIQSDIIIKLEQEYKDRSRKDITMWREAIEAAENPEDPRWFLLQDIIDDLLLDAHLCSVIDIRKSATLNHRFYVIDKDSSQQLDEQNALLLKRWFYELLEFSLDSIFRKVSLLELLYDGENMSVNVIPRRNICPQRKRIYTEVSGDKFIDYSMEPNILEIQHASVFGMINEVIPNLIWKRNALQSYAEFTERFGMPLVSATVSNIQDAKKAEAGLKNLGESATAVFPVGADVKVHSLANAGNPESTYVRSAEFHDDQISKRFIGSTTLTDEGANRSQTQVHMQTLDDKIAAADKRLITFVINDQLFPLLQNLGLPFDNTKMAFQFDETEDLTLPEQWNITREALIHYDLDEDEIKKTFNLPIVGKKIPTDTGGGLFGNFQ
jgi:hypothetical protein